MSKKLFLCAVLFLFTSSINMDARHKKTRRTVQTEQRYREIDNYDFLYTGEEYDFEQSSPVMDNVIDEAFTHIGARYVHGGKGPYVFDCSGFTSYVYKQIGVNISPSSKMQYATQTPIHNSELQRGDLVFFQGRRGRGGVGHVGIVVDVDHNNGTFNFIHASTSRGVRVSNSTESYYRSRYIGARRVME